MHFDKWHVKINYFIRWINYLFIRVSIEFIKKYSSTQNFQGITTINFRKGAASFSSLQIFADPNSEVFLKASTSAINKYYGNFFNIYGKNYSDQNSNGAYSYIFSVKLRKCQKGEIYLKQTNRLKKNK